MLLLVLGVIAAGWVHATPGTGTFPLSEFGGPTLESASVQEGLRTLFRGTSACRGDECPSFQQLERLTADVHGLHERLRSLVHEHRVREPQVPFRVEKSHWGGLNAFESYDFSFPSLIRRASPHPADRVYGRYLVPRRLKGCEHAFPTLVIVHSAIDNFEADEKVLADTLVALSQRLGVMWIYLPHFGPRRARIGQPMALNSDFLKPDLSAMRANFIQGVLDLHLALDWLKAWPHSVDPRRISMVGFSMGAIVQTLFEGMNPGQVPGGHIVVVGGGDLASFVDRYFKDNSKEPIVQDFLRAGWEESQGREALAGIDPIVWAHRIRGLPILSLVAERDEIMDLEMNVNKMVQSMGATNQHRRIWLSTPHAPRGASLFHKFSKIFLPILQFALQRAPEPAPYACKMER